MNMLNDIETSRGRIETAFHEEEKSGKAATTRNDVPFNYERISLEWWTMILCKDHSGARVVSYRAEAADNLNRGHVRIWLEYNDAGKAAGLPGSVFCKDSQKLELRAFNALAGLVQGEELFYNRIRPLIDLETPKCLFAKLDPRSFNSIVVMEDLIPQGSTFCTMATKVTREVIEKQLSYLARWHGKFYGTLDKYPMLAGWRTLSDFYNRVNQIMGLDKLSNMGFLASESVIPPRLFARYAEVWPATKKVIDSHQADSQVLGHNDAHFRNWYMCADGDMRLADWQIISRSGWGHDITFAMSTSLTVENRRAWEKDLLKFYLDKLHEAGAPALDFDEAWNNYRRHLFFSLLCWTPIVKHSSDYEWQPITETQEIIGRVATAIDDLDAFDSFD